MELASIASGSSGNCILVKSDNANIIVDIGISRKRVVEGLEFFDTKPSDIDAIFITHEHLDHIKGLGVYLRSFATPVYGSKGTIDCLKNEIDLGPVDYSLFNVIDERVEINDIVVKPIATKHDAAEPVLYRFESDDSAVAVVTDLGCYDKGLVQQLQGLDGLLVEANHDVNMLQVGPYPYNLKTRIWSDQGHLSNETCAKLVDEISSSKLKHVILGHLSGENNYPDLACQTVRNELDMSDSDITSDDIEIKVANRKSPSVKIVV